MPADICKLINDYVPRNRHEVLAEYFHHFMTAEKLECNDLFGNIVMNYQYAGPDEIWLTGEIMLIYDTKVLYSDQQHRNFEGYHVYDDINGAEEAIFLPARQYRLIPIRTRCNRLAYIIYDHLTEKYGDFELDVCDEKRF